MHRWHYDLPQPIESAQNLRAQKPPKLADAHLSDDKPRICRSVIAIEACLKPSNEMCLVISPEKIADAIFIFVSSGMYFCLDFTTGDGGKFLRRHFAGNGAVDPRHR